MEPQKHPTEKENHLPTSIFKFHVEFQGSTPIFTKKPMMMGRKGRSIPQLPPQPPRLQALSCASSGSSWGQTWKFSPQDKGGEKTAIGKTMVLHPMFFRTPKDFAKKSAGIYYSMSIRDPSSTISRMYLIYLTPCTPWKINMKPTRHPFTKPPWLCSMLIFKGGWRWKQKKRHYQ